MLELFLELRTGAAGDMLLSALVAAGADKAKIVEGLEKLGIDGWKLEFSEVIRSGISSTYALVHDHTPESGHSHDKEEKNGHHHSESHEQVHGHTHDHAQHHEHEHGQKKHGPLGHNHGHSHNHDAGHCHDAHGGHHTNKHVHEHGHGLHGRHLKDMLAIVGRAPFSVTVCQRAEQIFRLLAEAEGRVHGKSPDEVHFHEVSGIDTIIDVFGVCLALDLLGIEKVVSTPVSVGAGTVKCAHGVMPVPAPATQEILKLCNIPYTPGPVEKELLTPTGAAILGVVCSGYSGAPTGVVKAVGYGAGMADFADYPNVVRASVIESVVLGGSGCKPYKEDEVVEIRALVDDATGEELGAVMETCLGAGALDVSYLNAVMKKSRPGVEMVAMCSEDNKDAVIAAIFKSGITLGLRWNKVRRYLLERKETTVSVLGDKVAVKCGYYGGKVVSVKAEYDDCLRVSQASGKSLSEVRRLAEQEAAAGF